MIEKLTLTNFRCFEKHEIPFREKTVIVGRNNAGKSSVIEALRLVSIIVERYRGTSYSSPPRWLELHRSNRGVSPSLDSQAFNFDLVFHRHSDPPAIVECFFQKGETVTVYIGRDNQIHGVIRTRNRHIVSSKSEAMKLDLPKIAVLPQVAPVRLVEKTIDPDRVRQYASSTLSPLHFRNQLLVFPRDTFDEFKRISEDTWHGLSVGDIEETGRAGDKTLRLMIRNEDFSADLSWMGHGLQMWLQTMWFLARCREFDTVILDEPDVYMHADLQRKLMRFVRDRYPQVVIATHSIEIMAEVEPDEILIIDRDKREAKFASDLPEVQEVISQIGGVHNLQLARIVSSKRCLFIEGDDLQILKKFQNTLFPRSEFPVDVIPHLSIGGWGGWVYVLGSSMWVESTMRGVSKYCILDRDYHTDEQLRERVAEAANKGIRLMVWQKKELENYLLVPSALFRMLRKAARRGPSPSEEAIVTKLLDIAESLRPQVISGMADELSRTDKRSTPSALIDKAKESLEREWGDPASRLAMISGKAALTALNQWSQAEYKISITNAALAREMRFGEIDQEIKDFLSAIEYNEAF